MLTREGDAVVHRHIQRRGSRPGVQPDKQVGIPRGKCQPQCRPGDDGSTVRSEVECDAIISLEDGACKCLLSYGNDSGGNERQTPPVGDKMWLVDAGACKCLLSYGNDSGSNEGQTPPVGDKMWLIDGGASAHFTYDSIEGYADCNKTLRCAGGATYPIVGPVA